MVTPTAETVTFLFTDIEGSTRLLERLGDRYQEVLEDHFRLLRKAVTREQGREFGSEGDALFACFASAQKAVAAATAAQRALVGHAWPDGESVQVRMGIHTGEATATESGYVGLDVHRAARIAAAGHGGQVLLSRATRELLGSALPERVTLRDLGEHSLKDLSSPEHLYQLVIPDLRDNFPPIRSLSAHPINLPTQLTSFVGRDGELAETKELLHNTRLLTLTGPGGTGKTRLGLQLSAEVAEEFPDGVYFVPLAPLSDPELVASAIVAAIGLEEASGALPQERLIEYLRERRVLLLLDNFEQVLPAAPLVSELLRAAPRLKGVATSRAPLQVYGEQEYPVPPLGVPDLDLLPPLESLSQYEAVALFIERAEAVKPGFVVTNDNCPAIAEITYRLDGLPLAIELAAARVKVLTPQAILDRLGSRLTLLTGGSRDLPKRQQTLRDAIAWSYDLLDQAARRLMARLSVFVGGCRLEEAEAVCGPPEELGMYVLDGLETLIGHSLLRQEEGGGEARVRMLQVIREFALEQLTASGEEAEIRRRHAEAFLAIAEEAAPLLTGKEQADRLDLLGVEHDDMRAALAFTIEQSHVALACRLAAALWRFWQMRGHIHEGRARLAEVLALPASAEHEAERGAALEAAGGLAYWQGDFEVARAHYEEVLAIQRRLGDPSGIANALYNLSFGTGALQGDPAAKAMADESLSIYRRLGDEAGIAKALWAMANYYFFSGDLAQARPAAEEAVARFRRLDDVFGLGWALYVLGLIALRDGAYAEAREVWSESLGTFEAAGDLSGVVFHLDQFSELAAAEGEIERGIRLAGATAALRKVTGAELFKVLSDYQGRTEITAASLSEHDVEKLFEQGRTMTVQQAVAYALGRPERL